MTKEIRRLIWFVGGELTFAGGGERLLLEGLKSFAEKGIEAVLFTNGGSVSREALFDGAYSPTMLPIKRVKSSILANFPALKRLKKINNLLEIRNTLSCFNPDIVIANSQFEAKILWILNLLTFKNKIKFVCFIHGSLFQFPDDLKKYALVFRSKFKTIWENDPVYKAVIPLQPRMKQNLVVWMKKEMVFLFEWIGVRSAKKVFVLTQKNKKEIELLYRHQQVVALHGAFSRSLFNYVRKEDKKIKHGITDKKMVLSVCRLVAKKQVDLIVKGFALFVQSCADYVLVIGGNGNERDTLVSLVKELKIEKEVVFAGFIAESELEDYYRSCDVFVTADNADYDITTFVALALGTKIVASSQHEFDAEVNELGLLFEAEPTPEGFSNAFYAADRSLRKQDSAVLTENLDSYTWEFYFSKILSECTKIIK